MKKRVIRLVEIFVIIMILSACGSARPKAKQDVDIEPAEEEMTWEEPDGRMEPMPKLNKDVDVDLTVLSSTMAYSEVYNMMYVPQDYIGKTVRMRGTCSVYENEENGQVYYACIIQDATACCAQGIEFALDDSYSYPDDYPGMGEDITVVGTFEIYAEDGSLYSRLKMSHMEPNG